VDVEESISEYNRKEGPQYISGEGYKEAEHDRLSVLRRVMDAGVLRGKDEAQIIWSGMLLI